jgi:hypothetical protein
LGEGAGATGIARPKLLELACNASDSDVQNRYATIAQHYRMLAEAEERSADQKGTERRSQRASAA